ERESSDPGDAARGMELAHATSDHLCAGVTDPRFGSRVELRIGEVDNLPCLITDGVEDDEAVEAAIQRGAEPRFTAGKLILHSLPLADVASRTHERLNARPHRFS